jgi:hypothetical protein
MLNDKSKHIIFQFSCSTSQNKKNFKYRLSISKQKLQKVSSLFYLASNTQISKLDTNFKF